MRSGLGLLRAANGRFRLSLLRNAAGFLAPTKKFPTRVVLPSSTTLLRRLSTKTEPPYLKAEDIRWLGKYPDLTLQQALLYFEYEALENHQLFEPAALKKIPSKQSERFFRGLHDKYTPDHMANIIKFLKMMKARELGEDSENNTTIILKTFGFGFVKSMFLEYVESHLRPLYWNAPLDETTEKTLTSIVLAIRKAGNISDLQSPVLQAALKSVEPAYPSYNRAKQSGWFVSIHPDSEKFDVSYLKKHLNLFVWGIYNGCVYNQTSDYRFLGNKKANITDFDVNFFKIKLTLNAVLRYALVFDQFKTTANIIFEGAIKKIRGATHYADLREVLESKSLQHIINFKSLGRIHLLVASELPNFFCDASKTNDQLYLLLNAPEAYGVTPTLIDAGLLKLYAKAIRFELKRDVVYPDKDPREERREEMQALITYNTTQPSESEIRQEVIRDLYECSEQDRFDWKMKHVHFTCKAFVTDILVIGRSPLHAIRRFVADEEAAGVRLALFAMCRSYWYEHIANLDESSDIRIRPGV